MKRPDTIPADATWSEEDKHWNIGQRNDAGKEIGLWQAWSNEGYLCGTTDYGNGTPPFLFKRFHPDGTLAQQGNWHGGNLWLGTYRWSKSSNPTTEHFPGGMAKDSAKAWSIEFDYVAEGMYDTQRYYDKNEKPVNAWGKPLPKRPESVPAKAHHVQVDNKWVMGTVNGMKGFFSGEYFEWDMNGTPIVRRIYGAETGNVIEEHTYHNGKLWSSTVYGDGELTQSFYHSDIEPAVIEKSILYRNNNQDKTTTLFNEKGKRLFSYRFEEISNEHHRRYYNDALVYEGIQQPEDSNIPTTYLYFFPNGSKRIDYTANGNGTGTWNLYDERGAIVKSMPEHYEDDLSASYTLFLPYDYTPGETPTDWESMEQLFDERYTTGEAERTIRALEVPTYLAAELGKFNWEEIESAMYGSAALPLYINGMLSDNDDVANTSAGKIWYEIEHQNSVYESTYAVAGILARMIPHYTGKPAIVDRLLGFVYDVLRLGYITDIEELYGELQNAVDPLHDLIFERAKRDTNDIAFPAQYMLTHTANANTDTVAFFRAQLNNDRSSVQRAYATFALGGLYTRTQQVKTIITELSPRVTEEKDALVRLVMAIELVLASKKNAEDAWLSILIDALSNPEPLEEGFGELVPFVSNYDVVEYIIAVFGHTKRAALERNIDVVIDTLPTANPLKQVTLLQAIFFVLFPNKAAQKDITPVRKKALLAVSDVVDAHAIFLNHKEVFDEFDLPYDSYTLRQMADGILPARKKKKS